MGSGGWVDWTSAFDHAGTILCPYNRGIRKLKRSACNELHCLEKAYCREGLTNDCLWVRWQYQFDHKGWIDCPDQYGINGFERESGNGLGNLIGLRCCKFA